MYVLDLGPKSIEAYIRTSTYLSKCKYIMNCIELLHWKIRPWPDTPLSHNTNYDVIEGASFCPILEIQSSMLDSAKYQSFKSLVLVGTAADFLHRKPAFLLTQPPRPVTNHCHLTINA